MSVIDIRLYTPISDKLKVKESTTGSISESFKIGEMRTIYSKLISNLQNMIDAENAYYIAKDTLVNELPMVMSTENYEYGSQLSQNVNIAIENIKRIYQAAQEDVNRLYELTQISELKFEKQYIFGFSENRTEMTLITGLKLLDQYLSN
jgi:hypothetical protein